MKFLKIAMLFLLTTLIWSCQESEEFFDNKAYVKKDKISEIIYFKETVPDQTKDFVVNIAIPAKETVILNANTNSTLVNTYNSIYNQNAEILPSENYKILNTKIEIKTGAVESNSVVVEFKKFNTLKREKVYVLPISISSSNMDVLRSKQTYYYVFKPAALINDVANISKNYCSINWTNPDVCNNFSQLTCEALIRVKKFDKIISTLMGIEGGYLIRIGDAGWPSNQIQVVSASDNFPDPNDKYGLPINKWTHIAVVSNFETQEIIIYVNGKKQCEGKLSAPSVVNLATNNFFIGKSYNNDRYLDGEISEVRIWNKIRTAKEIANNPYKVNPKSEGLVAYWKFDDKNEKIIKDYTGNENNAQADKPLTWISVELPKNNE